MTVSEQQTLESQIDMAELLCRVENDRELLQEIFGIFNDEFPRAYEALLDAVRRQDLKQISVGAHTLKGMLASLSFVTASASAKRVEHLARNGNFEGVMDEVGLLERASLAAQGSLRKLCAEAHA